MFGPPDLSPSPAAALLVDAGFVLAAARRAAADARPHERIGCRHDDLVASLWEFVDAHSGGMRRLRTYWYDAAVDARPTLEHSRIALVPYVSLRVGRLTTDGRHQKGLDLMIYRDLVRLARERAISRAYVLGGDDDLRDGIGEVKELGVQVVLLGFAGDEGSDQSGLLVREADEVALLPAEAWQPHFRTAGAADAADDADVARARELGERFAHEWVRRASRREVEEVLERFPAVPKELDIALVVYAERQLGPLRRRPDLKQEVRGTFWFATKGIVSRAGANVSG
jgi:hypothetical protein